MYSSSISSPSGSSSSPSSSSSSSSAHFDSSLPVTDESFQSESAHLELAMRCLPILNTTKLAEAMDCAVMCLNGTQRDMLEFISKSLQQDSTLTPEQLSFNFYESSASVTVTEILQNFSSLDEAGQLLVQEGVENRQSGMTYQENLPKLHAALTKAAKAKKNKLKKLKSSMTSSSSSSSSSSSLPSPCLATALIRALDSIQNYLAAKELPFGDLAAQFKSEIKPTPSFLFQGTWQSQPIFELKVPPHLLFKGSWQSQPIPAGIPTILWPPEQARIFTHDEFKRSLLGQGTHVVQKESFKFVGHGKIINLLESYISGADKLIRINPDQFFLDMMAHIHTWLNLPYSKELGTRMYHRFEAVDTLPITEEEKKRVVALMKASGQVPAGEKEEHVKDWTRMFRMSDLLNEYPTIKLIGMMNIRAAAGAQTIQYQCIPELFTNIQNENHRHLYITRLNRTFGTHILLQLPNKDEPYHRVTQLTHWDIFANPRREQQSELPLATINLEWITGVDLNNASIPLKYDYIIRRLKFGKETTPTDRFMLTHIFKEAQKRYQALIPVPRLWTTKVSSATRLHRATTHR